MKISNRQLARNLYMALQEVKEKERSQVLQNFVKILHKMRKFSQVDRIIEEYLTYEKEMNGMVDISVTTAHPLTEEMKKMITEQFGKEMSLRENIDKEILGGIIIKTKNTIYDASLKTSIEQLKNTL